MVDNPKPAPGQVVFTDVRASFIWSETDFSLLSVPPPPAPMAFLGQPVAYGDRFKQLLQATSPNAGLDLPWVAKSRPHFWRNYLRLDDPHQMPAGQAWRFVVPFRQRVPLKITAAKSGQRIVAEGFYYPHGTALVITVTDRTSQPMPDGVQAICDLRSHDKFTLEGAGGAARSLDQVAKACLAWLREASRGKDGSTGTTSLDPFSVVTVIHADGADAKAAPAPGDTVHRMLEAWTGWRPTWKSDALGEMTKGRIKIRTAPDGHVLYGSTRARAAWFPDGFAKVKLSCYHRNLTLLSTQVESLGDAVKQTVEQAAGNFATLSVPHVQAISRSAKILEKLHDGNRDATYQSYSARRHIEESGLLDPIKAMLNATA